MNKITGKLPQIIVRKTRELKNGSLVVDFDVDDAFIAYFKKETGEKKATKKKLGNFVLGMLEKAVAKKDGWDIGADKKDAV